MNEIYVAVAKLFADRINAIFESEGTMQEEFKKHLGELEFTRTDFWSTILYKVFRDCWLEAGPAVKAEPTGYDRLAVLRELYKLIDYNLFTQVLLNLQQYTGMAYQTKDAEKEMERLKNEWPKTAKLDPFAAKAKMIKTAQTDEEKQFNMVLSTMRSLKIISQFTPQVSFRVSPKGSTPAFADSRNVSMLGVGADQYLRTIPSLKVFYITWEPGTAPWMLTGAAPPKEGMPGLLAEGISYPFHSKSGGQILSEVLFARKVMAEVFAYHDITAEACIMVPRMNSIMIVTDKYGHHLNKAFEALSQKYPMLNLQEGTRAA